LNIKKKFKILKKKEAQIKEISKKNKKANTVWRQYKTVYCYSNHYSSKKNSNSFNINIIKISFEYYCYRSIEYYITNCKFQTANKNYIKNLYLKKEKGDTNAKPSRTIEQTKKKKFHLTERKQSIKPFKRKKYSYIAANQLSNDSKYYIGTESPLEDDNKKKLKSDKIKKVIFTKEEISKSTPTDWALNTKASLFITDQFDLYKKESLKSLYNVFI